VSCLTCDHQLVITFFCDEITFQDIEQCCAGVGGSVSQSTDPADCLCDDRAYEQY
jgi:hypothetical protein